MLSLGIKLSVNQAIYNFYSVSDTYAIPVAAGLPD